MWGSVDNFWKIRSYQETHRLDISGTAPPSTHVRGGRQPGNCRGLWKQRGPQADH